MKKISWEEVDKILDGLVDKIKASGFMPDYLVGITNGGLIPLYFLAKKLDDFDNVLTICSTSYDKDRNKELKILYFPDVDLKDKKVLLIDEIAESGDTLKEITKILIDKYKVGGLKTLTLGVNTDKSKFYPDFWAVEQSGDWVVFPWEKGDFPTYSKD